jgi:hypothetical protein
VTIVDAGTLYAAAPAVTFSAAPAGGSTAAGTAVLAQDGTVASVSVTDGGSGYTTAPTVTIAAGGGVTATATSTIVAFETMDVLNITVLWGTQRIVLERWPFTRFQAYMRTWTVPGQPRVCASYGQASWYIGPVPDQQYQSEWDSIITPDDLVNLTDVSPVRYPYSDTIPFYSTHIAKFKEQSLNEADFWLTLYQRKMQHAIRSAMMRKLPSAYGS